MKPEMSAADRGPERRVGAPRLSNAPLSDPALILQRMPTQAISPALLELLDVMSSPIMMISAIPAGDPIEMPLAPAASVSQSSPAHRARRFLRASGFAA